MTKATPKHRCAMLQQFTTAAMPKFGPTDTAIWVYVLANSDDQLCLTIKLPDLGAALGVEGETCVKPIQRLIAAGYLSKTRPRASVPYTYTVCVPEEDQADD